MFFSLLTFLFTLPTLIISAPSPLFRLTPDSLTAPPQIAGKPLVINTLNARYPYLGIDLPGADRDFVGYFKDSKNLTGEVYVNGVLVNEVAERVQILFLRPNNNIENGTAEDLEIRNPRYHVRVGDPLYWWPWTSTEWVDGEAMGWGVVGASGEDQFLEFGAARLKGGFGEWSACRVVGGQGSEREEVEKGEKGRGWVLFYNGTGYSATGGECTERFRMKILF